MFALEVAYNTKLALGVGVMHPSETTGLWQKGLRHPLLSRDRLRRFCLDGRHIDMNDSQGGRSAATEDMQIMTSC